MNPTRRKSPHSPSCESLEGRQLLAAGAGADLGIGLGMPPMAMGGTADVSTTGLGNAPSGHRGGQGGWARDSTGAALGGTAGADGFRQAGFGNQGHGDTLLGQGGRGDFGGMGDPATQGTMFPGAVGSTGTGSTGVTSQLQTDLQKLRTDQQAIHDKSNVTPAMEALVRKDIQAIKGAETTTPDASATTTLQNDIKTAMANVGGPTDAQLAQIQADQDAIYKSQGVSDGLIAKLTTDQQAIKTASGITDADRSTIAADQKAIQADRAAAPPPAQAAAVPATSTTPPATPTDPNATTPPAATPTATPAAATAATPSAASATPTTPPAVPTTPTSAPALSHADAGTPAMSHRGAHHPGAIGRPAHRRRG